MEEFRRLCRERRLPLTPQRLAILETVLALGDHPTTDHIHVAVGRRLTGVSRATVYRTLERLARMGVITKACHPGHAVRYDPRTEVHHHFVCLRCDGIVDISDPRLDALPVPGAPAPGFEVSDFRVQLRGHCPRCQNRKERES